MRQLQPYAKSDASSTGISRALLYAVQEGGANTSPTEVWQYGKAPEIQKSVDGFVESEPRRNVANDGHERPTARQPPAHGVDRFVVRARGRIEKPFVLGKRGPQEVQNRGRIRAGGLPHGYSP